MTPKQVDECIDAYLEAHPAGWTMARTIAANEVDRIIFLIEARRRGGQLGDINAAYRRARLAGETRLPFSRHWAALVRAMVIEAANLK